MLTQEERLLIASAAAGEPIHVAAARISRSASWVNARRSELLRRFDAPTMTALVARAVAGGWLEPRPTTDEEVAAHGG